MIRLFDIIFSTVLLFLFSPLIIIISILNFATGEHEIFFFQKRVGNKGKLFNIIKFATMLKNSPNIGAGGFTEINDPRLLPLGRFLRKSKFNELPQLINVLKGDMSMVGFRPLIPASYATALEIAGKNAYDSKPGITSPASIYFRNEEEELANLKSHERQRHYDQIILPKKVALDIWWNSNMSTYNYFMILVLTALCLILPYRLIPTWLLKDLPNFSD